MKLSFLTGTIGDLEKAARLGFDGIELQATAFGNVAVQKPDKAAIDHARRLVEQHNVEITAMAYYGLAKGHFETEADISRAYERVFDIAEALGVRVIASMSGFDAGRDWQGNLQLFADRFGPIAEMAAQRGLLIALENWMSVSGHLPFKPINFGGSPDTWDFYSRLSLKKRWASNLIRRIFTGKASTIYGRCANFEIAFIMCMRKTRRCYQSGATVAVSTATTSVFAFLAMVRLIGLNLSPRWMRLVTRGIWPLNMKILSIVTSGSMKVWLEAGKFSTPCFIHMYKCSLQMVKS